jgi:hypothetical protein
MFSVQASSRDREQSSTCIPRSPVSTKDFARSLDILSASPLVNKGGLDGEEKTESQDESGHKKAKVREEALRSSEPVIDLLSQQISSLATVAQTQPFIVSPMLTEVVAGSRSSSEGIAETLSLSGFLPLLGGSPALLHPFQEISAVNSTTVPAAVIESSPLDDKAQVSTTDSPALADMDQNDLSTNKSIPIPPSQHFMPVSHRLGLNLPAEDRTAFVAIAPGSTELQERRTPVAVQMQTVSQTVNSSIALESAPKRTISAKLEENQSFSERKVSKDRSTDRSEPYKRVEGLLVPRSSKPAEPLSPSKEAPDFPIQAPAIPISVVDMARNLSADVPCQGPVISTEALPVVSAPIAPVPPPSVGEGNVLQAVSDHQLPTPVSASKLIQTLSQSEMSVGMRSAEFGKISIRTSLTADSVFAHITLEHEGLAKALATHAPELQAKFGESQIHSVQIEMNQATTSGEEGGQSKRNDSESYRRFQTKPTYMAKTNGNTNDEINTHLTSSSAIAGVGGHLRLDIQI